MSGLDGLIPRPVREVSRCSLGHALDEQGNHLFSPEIAEHPIECDPLDDNQDHHDWDYETHGGCLGVCKRCGTLSQGWEE